MQLVSRHPIFQFLYKYNIQLTREHRARKGRHVPVNSRRRVWVGLPSDRLLLGSLALLLILLLVEVLLLRFGIQRVELSVTLCLSYLFALNGTLLGLLVLASLLDLLDGLITD